MKNEYFKEDLTRINDLISPEYQLPQDKWEELSQEERNVSVAKGPSYTLLQYFVYGNSQYFEEYEVRDTKVKCYMVDFKKVTTICCVKINRKDISEILHSKILELSPTTRKQLREKLGYFYSRPADEDLVELGGSR